MQRRPAKHGRGRCARSRGARPRRQAALARVQRGLRFGDLGGTSLERLLGRCGALLELAALSLELLRDLGQRALTRFNLGALFRDGRFELTSIAITLGDCHVAFPDSALTRREPCLCLLLARLERRAFALQLALTLADFGELLRELGGGLCTVALGVLELVDASFGVAGELLDTCVLRDDLRVPLDQSGLLALEHGDALLE